MFTANCRRWGQSTQPGVEEPILELVAFHQEEFQKFSAWTAFYPDY